METSTLRSTRRMARTFKTSLEEWKQNWERVYPCRLQTFKTSLEEWKHLRVDRGYLCSKLLKLP